MPAIQPLEPLGSQFLPEWARLEKHVRAALKYAPDTHSDRTVLDRILTGKAQFFAYEDSCMVTEIIKYPKNKVCRVWLAGGNLKQIHQLGEQVVAWATEQGCTDAEIIGRDGWERAAPGFKKAATVYRRQL